GMMGKDEVVSVMEAERGWDAVDFDDVRWVHSASTSLPGYQARARWAGSGEIDYQAMIASGYRKDDDGWRLVFHQQTPLVCPRARCSSSALPGRGRRSSTAPCSSTRLLP